MSTAAAAEGAGPARSGRKKLLVVVVAALLLLGAAGGGVLWWLKARAQAAALAAEDEDAALQADGQGAPRRDPSVAPVFLPLDSFTVNLADREADRYAQIGISLELEDPKAGERIRVFMPAIRNNILMVLSHKRSADLMPREGKAQLAAEVLAETERALGYDRSAAARKGGDAPLRPVRAVHFSNFIIQ